jgi:hypothetical protein
MLKSKLWIAGLFPLACGMSLALSPARAEDPPPAPAAPDDLATIERDLASAMDELVAARARAGVVARALFRSQLAVDVVRRADDQRLAHVTLRLDGVPVHESDGSALATDRASLFTGYVAPGMHELGVELTEAARENADFGYVRRESFRIEVKKDRRTAVELVLRDDSDMAEEAADGDDGSYQLQTTLRVRTEKVRD